MEWQPISGAPTDGTKVDLWVPDEAFEGGGQRFPDMQYRQGSASEANDWDGDMLCLSDCGYRPEDVTHFMIVTAPNTPA